MDAVTQVFEPEEMLPAPGQGALAVECRDGDTPLAELLSSVDDPVSRAAVTAERAVLAALHAGCSAPVGAYAAGTKLLHVTAVIAAVDGESAVRASASAPAAEAARLGGDVAAELLRQGAARFLALSSEHLSNGDDA
jgi:hydroxymethylbilane synthase